MFLTIEEKIKEVGLDSVVQTKDQAIDLKQRILDHIETRKSVGVAYPDAWLERLSKLDYILSEDKEAKATDRTTKQVFGHPLATSNPTFYGLVPLKVSSSDQIDRCLERVQLHLDRLGEKIGQAHYIARLKKSVKVSAKQIKEAKAYLASHAYLEDTTHKDLLNEETIPELIRLKRLFNIAS